MPKGNDVTAWLKAQALLVIVIAVLLQTCYSVGRLADSMAAQQRALERITGLANTNPSTSWVDRYGYAHVVPADRSMNDSDESQADRYRATLDVWQRTFPIR